jgi:hypothetical protein
VAVLRGTIAFPLRTPSIAGLLFLLACPSACGNPRGAADPPRVMAAPSVAPFAASTPPSRPTPHGIEPDEPRDAELHHALRADALGVIRAFANRAARWSPDLRSVVFRSDRNGSWAAYVSGWQELDLPPRRVPSAAPVAHADFGLLPNQVLLGLERSAGWSLVTSDLESGTLGRWGPDGCLVTTPPVRAALARNAFVTVAPDRLLAGTFASPAQRDVRLEAGERFCGTDPQGQRFLLLDQPGTTRARLVEVDARGRRQERFDAAGTLRVDLAAYAPDGESVLVAGAMEGQPARVYRVGAQQERLKEVFEVPDANQNVVAIETSPRSPLFAVLTHGAAGAEVSLVRTSGAGRPVSVPLPVGEGSLEAFSRDGRVLTVTWETPLGPPDIWEVGSIRGSARKLRDDVRPTMARLEGLRWRRETITGAEGSLEAAVYEPTDRPARGAVLLLGEQGSIAGWRPRVRFLVGLGWVVIEPVTREPPSAETLPVWMKIVGPWTRGRWDKVAMVARSSCWIAALEALGNANEGWAFVVDPAPGEPRTARGSAWKGRSVLVSAERPGEAAEPLVRALRAAGANAEYAVGDQADRWAREAQFLATCPGKPPDVSAETPRTPP